MECAAAKSIYLTAVEQDIVDRYNTVLALYNESLRLLTDLIRGSILPLMKYIETKNEERKKQLTAKESKYRERADFIKILIHSKKFGTKYKDQIRIAEGSTGYGYETVFGRFLDACVTHISIEDPHIRALHQCQNLVRFCELCVKKCQSLSKITLVTGYADPENRNDQKRRLNELKISLIARKIVFIFSFNPTLHDRQIKLSNGWVIKIGRGLDYFCNHANGRFILGSCDLELRPCWDTTIDIYHTQSDNV